MDLNTLNFNLPFYLVLVLSAKGIALLVGVEQTATRVALSAGLVLVEGLLPPL